MDHTKLVIFLLIVLGTVATFGSPITEDSPKKYSEGPEGYPELSSDTKEQKKLSKSSDRDGKNVKRVNPGTVIAGASLAYEMLKDLLGAFGDLNRKIAIGIDNESDDEWKSINVHFHSGTSEAIIPRTVKSGEALLWGARKSNWSARGAVGVLTYYIPVIDKTLAVMYHVPYSYLWDDNFWNVKLYGGKVWASEGIFDQMYDHGNPFRGDNSWRSKSLGSGLYVTGAMSDAGKATLQIKVYQ